ncbi:NAD-dependent epimerase/dehydratase family protein [Flexivirga caeni]|uniref:NAD-dependent epimerase/dehydratase family protein n=1 Tax=Flexivirga caeni TaxID=2294115 RepID=A0A3M9MLA3_9MICO|nr:NAD-dependent epimerase/dehydratase family protein [Flexivirga caeni]RNI25448.1 NAD-dependent epimerase/dehydratase family protein [Flexivirga caeni]
MRIFVTGSTGWIGSATVDELLRSGYEVSGLARSDAAAAALEAKGAQVVRGDLDQPDALREAARAADGVVHLANKHDWADEEGNNRTERAAVMALLAGLEGSGKPVVVANGLSGIVKGRAVLESDSSPAVGPGSDRGGSENLALEASSRLIRSIAVRFAPSVHGCGDWGFVNWLTAAARRNGVSGYIDDGAAAWSAVHVTDAARLIRLALEEAPGGTRVHAVAEESVLTRQIAEEVGMALGLPVVRVAAADAARHFGVVGHFFGQTMTGSSAATRELLGWQPTGPTLLDDIRSGAYTQELPTS